MKHLEKRNEIIKKIDNYDEIIKWLEFGGILNEDNNGCLYIEEDENYFQYCFKQQTECKTEEEFWKSMAIHALECAGLKTSLINMLMDESQDNDFLIQVVNILRKEAVDKLVETVMDGCRWTCKG